VGDQEPLELGSRAARSAHLPQRLDLAVATSTSTLPFVMVLLNNTRPVSLTGSTFGAETNPDSVAVGDWNGDGGRQCSG
jgi:hypothetical protein